MSSFQLSDAALARWLKWGEVPPISPGKLIACLGTYGSLLLRTQPLTNTAPAGEQIESIHALVNLVGAEGYVFTHDTEPTSRPLSCTIRERLETSLRAMWRGEGSFTKSYSVLPEALNLDLELAFQAQLGESKWAELAQATWRREVFELLLYRLIQIMTEASPTLDLVLILEFWRQGWPLMGIDERNNLVIATAS